MNELSLFTGAGGGILGTALLGWNHVGYVEYDDFCQRVIAQRIRDGILENAPIFGDIQTFNSDGYAASYQGMVDVISGGFPCQDISYAGKGAGIEGARSGLWKEMLSAIRTIRPRYVLVENSAAILSRGLGTVLGDLASIGYDARWDCIPAGICGACHFRDRTWIVAHADSHTEPEQNKRQEKPGQRTPRWDNTVGLDMARDRAREAKTIFCGMDDAVAYRMERLRAIGNGQVPTVVKAAWEILSF